MSMHSKWLRGNLVFYENQRWFDAVGPTVVKRESVGANIGTDNLNGWTTTLVETGSGESTVTALATTPGGFLITTDNLTDDGVNTQSKGEMFKLDGAYPLYFGIKFQVSEATQSDFYIGLAVTTTDALAGVTDGVAFRKADGSTDVYLVVEKNSSETTAVVDTCAATTDVTLEFTWNGTYIDAYVDGVLQTRLAMTNLPNDEDLSPVIQFLTGADAAITMSVYWIRCIQCR